MEDWQEWQIRADEIASALSQEVDDLERTFFSEESDGNLRGFWPRFRDLKERVRTAPAIRLEAKLDLERRLRNLGSRAYKSQEAAYSRSGERKGELLSTIQELQSRADAMESPRDLRNLRRELDAIRQQFDDGDSLMPADRQSLWEAWRAANDQVWQRLTTIWSANEEVLRGILNEASQQLESGNNGAARQSIGRFFESLRTHESKQATMNAMKTEAEGIRRTANDQEEVRAAQRMPAPQVQLVSPVDGWRTEVERNRESITRLSDEISELEREFNATTSLLEQAMVRGTLVDKRRKLTELERTNRTLGQRIQQADETPVLPVS